MGCVLYATMYRRMPLLETALDIPKLWARARRMEVSAKGPVMPLPSSEEAAYLLGIAERVALKGFQPKSLVSQDQVLALEDAYRRRYNDQGDTTVP
jgi:hypothetical protein